MRPERSTIYRRFGGCFFTAFLLLSAAAHAEPVVVEKIRLGMEPQRTRLVLDLSAAVEYDLERLEQPARVVVELRDTTLSEAPPASLLRGSAVTRLLPVAIGASDLRVTLVLASQRLDVKHFTLRPDPATGLGHRLVIDLMPQPKPPPLLAADPIVDTPMVAASLVVNDAVNNEAEEVAGPVATEEPIVSQASGDSAPVDVDDLLNIGSAGVASSSGPSLSGYLEASAAYTFAKPEHWSKVRARLELALSGSFGSSVRYKFATRLDGDAAYIVEDDFYPSAVRDDQRFEAQIREFYVDFGSGPWAHRVGRQHIVWGEMVGLFLADVVSARDTREFYLQNFEAMRIPQWAWNTQYFAGDSTFELVYIPLPSVDNIGEPGADFYPFPLPAGTPVRDERPDRDLNTYNWGVRASTLERGWSLSAYYYDSISVAPTLVPETEGFSLNYQPIEQVGGTFSKDLGSFVFKGEAVFAKDRRFQSFDPTDPGALLVSDALDWVVGATIPLGDWRWDLQLYGRRSFDHDPRMGFDDDEFGATVLVNYALNSRVELEILALAGLNREDYLLRPKIAWRFARDWRLQAGADVFGGSEIGLFGPYDNRDRVYLELKRWF